MVQDGFIFNSPFLDWGKVGGPVAKLVLMYAPALLARLHVWSHETELLGGGGPSAWALQLYSQYPFDPRSRPLARRRAIEPNRARAPRDRRSDYAAALRVRRHVSFSCRSRLATVAASIRCNARHVSPRKSASGTTAGSHGIFSSG